MINSVLEYVKSDILELSFHLKNSLCDLHIIEILSIAEFDCIPINIISHLTEFIDVEKVILSFLRQFVLMQGITTVNQYDNCNHYD